MPTINISEEIKQSLIRSVEGTIDMLNDMAVDPMFMTPSQVRELSGASDTTIRETFTKNAKEVFENVDQLINLQLLLVKLNAE